MFLYKKDPVRLTMFQTICCKKNWMLYSLKWWNERKVEMAWTHVANEKMADIHRFSFSANCPGPNKNVVVPNIVGGGHMEGFNVN